MKQFCDPEFEEIWVWVFMLKALSFWFQSRLMLCCAVLLNAMHHVGWWSCFNFSINLMGSCYLFLSPCMLTCIWCNNNCNNNKKKYIYQNFFIFFRLKGWLWREQDFSWWVGLQICDLLMTSWEVSVLFRLLFSSANLCGWKRIRRKCFDLFGRVKRHLSFFFWTVLILIRKATGRLRPSAIR